MNAALLFLGKHEDGLHVLKEGADDVAAFKFGAAGLFALLSFRPVVDRPAALKGGKAVGLRGRSGLRCGFGVGCLRRIP